VNLRVTVTATGAIAPPDVKGAINRAVRRATALVQARTAGLLSGVLVQRKTGRLLSALRVKVEQRPRGSMGVVGIDNRAFYALFLDKGAQAHELGKGARTARAATPRRRGQRSRAAFTGRRSQVMRFQVGGDTVFRARAHHPGIRPRHFMLTALDGARPEIQRIFQEETERLAVATHA
jgi:hypothetical protein